MPHARATCKVKNRTIQGSCSTTLDRWRDAGSRNFVVVKFSMIKSLKPDETGFHLHGNTPNLCNWRGQLKSRECPPNSGNHVVYVALPKDTHVVYKWMLMGSDRRTVKEKEMNRSIEIKDEDIIIQDYFGVYTPILPNVFEPDYHKDDQELVPVVFLTHHTVPDKINNAVAVVGSTPDLGRWRAMNARVLFQVEENVWASIIYLPYGVRLRYKFAIVEKSKHKRILYGERKEHKISIEKPNDEHEIHEYEDKRKQRMGIWTPSTGADVLPEHVEEQSMGSVASDISLGTKVSIASDLSNISEDRVGDVEESQEDVASIQRNLINELKKELVSEVETQETNLHTERAAASISLRSLNDLSNLSSREICAAWLSDQHIGDKEFIDVEAGFAEDSTEADEKKPLLEDITNYKYTEEVTAGEQLPAAVNFESENIFNELNDEVETLQSAIQPTDEDYRDETPLGVRLSGTEHLGQIEEFGNGERQDLPFHTESSTVVDQVVYNDYENSYTNEEDIFDDNLMTHSLCQVTKLTKLDNDESSGEFVNGYGAEGTHYPYEQHDAHFIMYESASVIPAKPQQEVASVLTPNPVSEDCLSTMTQAGTISLSGAEKVVEEIPVQRELEGVVACNASCLSLNTSTAHLPCYCTRNQSPVDIARRIRERLPWITDLPHPLICRVLHTVGILKPIEQTEIANFILKPPTKV